MPVNEFEKQVQQKMDELKFTPAPEVWTEVEKRIRKEKKRRRIIFWWLLPLLLVGGGTAYFITRENTGSSIAEKTTTTDHKDQNEPPKDQTPEIPNRETITSEKLVTSNNENRIPESGTVPTQTQSSRTNSESSTRPSTIDLFGKRAIIPVAPKKNITEKPTSIKEEKPSRTNQRLVVVPPQANDDKVIVRPSAVVNDSVQLKDRPATELLNDSVVVSTATKKAEEVVVIEKNKETENEVAETEPASTVATTTNKKKKWIPGVSVRGGSSNTRRNGLFSGGQASFDPSSMGNVGTGSNSSPLYLSAPESGLSLGAGFIVQKELSPRLSLQFALQYDYFSTHIQTGARVDSTRQLNNSISDLTVSNYYQPYMGGNGASDYTNKYHFAGVTSSLSWKVINGRKFSLSWENGVGVSRLLATNALHYDPNLKAYYNDFEPFRKIQVVLNTGFSIPLINKQTFRLSVDPYVSYAIPRVLKENNAVNAHYVNYGVGMKILLPRSK